MKNYAHFIVFILLSYPASGTTFKCLKAMGALGDHLYHSLKQHGRHTLSFASLQPGMRYFHTEDGYVAYDSRLGIDVALGDPLVSRGKRKAFIRAFLKEHPTAVFAHISEDTARDLSEMGWYVNELGQDSKLHLDTYDFTGKKKAKFRQAAAKLEREGFSIEEIPHSEETVQAAIDITEEWRQGKVVSNREVRFLNRPIEFDEEIDVRKFFVRDGEGKILSFVYFDPIYEHGEIIGYSASIKRRSNSAPTGAEEATVKHAIETFKEEGKLIVTLGLTPLSNLQDRTYRTDWVLSIILKGVRRFGDERIYSFKGHEDFKHRYRGEPENVYFASPAVWNARRFIAVMKISEIF